MTGDLKREYRHIPVMADRTIEELDLGPGKIFVDCTLGGAGHSVLAAEKISDGGTLVGIDEDPMAIEAASNRISEEFPNLDFRPVQGDFVDLDDILCRVQVPGADAILFDLGLSSPQIDFPERGFSYKVDAPLDMRRNSGKHTKTAAEVIATTNETDLARIIRDYGEERWASRIASFIVKRRKVEPIETTQQLVDVIKAAIPASARRKGGHPAKRTFQALRIEVNNELGELKIALESAIRWLNPGGRVAVISYHSLEDRIVKETFAEMAQGCTCPPDIPVCVCGNKPKIKILTRKPIVPTEEEQVENPRSKSAKLRVAEKLDTEPGAER
ncbi:MAG: 16S rRNA (cytosine(1402)-N(4))-methyltransferase RsmH [Coriobacteriales bacterium]|jgi:16S rRNA (cytosine1402-N4)-methyltransferase